MKGSILMKKVAFTVCIMSLLFSLFGCTEKNYPFDTGKAYLYRRGGMIAGGDCRITMEPDGIIKYYSYADTPPRGELGMNDTGADIYFVGLNPGEVKVTVEMIYPTTEPQVNTFVLIVDEQLTVTSAKQTTK